MLPTDLNIDFLTFIDSQMDGYLSWYLFFFICIQSTFNFLWQIQFAASYPLLNWIHTLKTCSLVTIALKHVWIALFSYFKCFLVLPTVKEFEMNDHIVWSLLWVCELQTLTYWWTYRRWIIHIDCVGCDMCKLHTPINFITCPSVFNRRVYRCVIALMIWQMIDSWESTWRNLWTRSTICKFVHILANQDRLDHTKYST